MKITVHKRVMPCCATGNKGTVIVITAAKHQKIYAVTLLRVHLKLLNSPLKRVQTLEFNLFSVIFLAQSFL